MITFLDAPPSVAIKEEFLNPTGLEFQVPAELEATEPPEARGLVRDAVRLMVSHFMDDTILHTCFRSIPDYLESGDVLVINTSGTLKAALNAFRADGTPLEIHLSTRLPGNIWITELRLPTEAGTEPFLQSEPGEVLTLRGGGCIQLLTAYDSKLRVDPEPSVRLWLSTLDLPMQLEDFIEAYGYPIRYSYVPRRWPIEAYQTVYTTERGSAEMPSAGRAFTTEIITRLVAKGVQVVPLILHTGVSSLEYGEIPHEEYYRVPSVTAQAVNQAHASGNRVVATGTTSVRALETVTDQKGILHPGEGWTSLVIASGNTPTSSTNGLHAVDGLLTGFHEPRSTHLDMLSALAGIDHIRLAYQAALEGKYLWHEFGDLHLILP